ncbi:MAG: hypothetical protein J6Z06_05720, partial [Lachnospiraceae bacterium]|nr:hypothetical protein [Lachnospiraceae bacterium]
LLSLVAATTMNGQTVLKGDMNNDGVIDISDVTALVNVAVGHTQAEASTAFYANFVDFKLKNKAPQQQEQAKQPAEPQKDALSNNPKAPNGPLFNM